ncbi:hypothetical protein NM208_g9268 [Fusarium decemcellulare]|uniref:Uncharacterized protein n=2 Tax=Fusarium decemcellulare TaxID=57161 RepID=A0ACC1RRM0_9HYPO|nr:hypothetical protein NM208_g12042 [Fusarium decemcellulare]KAJ3530569.1 hypothetical protein NM208_g9268 [Fusarium decemcellulare]
MEQAWGLADIPDLHGKVAVVTGASGIGLAIVAQLATHGAKVYFTARSLAKAEKAKQTLLSSYPEINSNNVNFLLLDFTDLKGITNAADELLKKETKLDILVNNAAASSPSTELVGGGWEVHMTTNFIGPFLFINRLMPLFKAATLHKDADVRIINISSVAQTAFLPRNFDFQFDKPCGLAKPVLHYPLQWRLGVKFIFSWDMIRFSISKTALILFATELQRRLDAQGIPIVTLSVHPGEAYTEGLVAVNNMFISTMARLFFASAEQGAVSPLFAATAKQVRQSPETYKARFLLPIGKVTSPHPVAEDEKQIKGLWDNTTTELNEALAAQGLPALGPCPPLRQSDVTISDSVSGNDHLTQIPEQVRRERSIHLDEPYVYASLINDRGQKEIRLLEILPSRGFYIIFCKVHHVTLWWPNHTTSLGPILLLGDIQYLPLTDDLYFALWRLWHPSKSRWMWVDEVCVNPQDNAEKAYQGLQLRGIYAKAKPVIIWLGEEDEYHISERGLGMARYINDVADWDRQHGIQRDLFQQAPDAPAPPPPTGRL